MKAITYKGVTLCTAKSESEFEHESPFTVISGEVHVQKAHPQSVYYLEYIEDAVGEKVGDLGDLSGDLLLESDGDDV